MWADIGDLSTPTECGCLPPPAASLDTSFFHHPCLVPGFCISSLERCSSSQLLSPTPGSSPPAPSTQVGVIVELDLPLCSSSCSAPTVAVLRVGPRTSSTNCITWELVRNAHSCLPHPIPGPAESERRWGWSSAACVFTSPVGDPDAAQVGGPGPREKHSSRRWAPARRSLPPLLVPWHCPRPTHPDATANLLGVLPAEAFCTCHFLRVPSLQAPRHVIL